MMDPKLAERIKSLAGFPVEIETWLRKSNPTQICIHHTASGPGTINDIEWWKRDGKPVSTPIVVGADGTAHQIYSSTRWAYSLGLRHAKAKAVEETTLSFEIDAWGSLKKKGEKFYAWPNNYSTEVPADEVCTLKTPHRGELYYHKYTAEQIETTRLLLIHWSKTYNIPLKVNIVDVFNLTDNAIYAKKPGIYSHVSFRADKNDIFPQEEMITMLKSL